MEQNSYYYNQHHFSYYPNPNPIPSSSSSSTTTGDGFLRLPGSVRYAHPHHTPAAAIGESYYYGIGGDLVHQQYARAGPFSYATLGPLSPSLNFRKINKVGTTRTYTDLEMKKCKVIQGGASADSVRVCTICNVVCNSDKVFASHVAGEKHALKVQMVLGISPMAIKPKVLAHLKTLHSIKNQTQPTPTTTSAANKASKGLVSFVQSAYCEVCKINCNSQEVLNNHKTGKKHMRNVQKLQKTSMTPEPAKVPEKSEVQKDASVKTAAQQPKALPTKKDLETKKQKVLNGGAAADAVRVCRLCNVVCNSESVFASHIEGQKHMSKLNKQQAVPE